VEVETCDEVKGAAACGKLSRYGLFWDWLVRRRRRQLGIGVV